MDLITALGRLLLDGRLRDAFTAHPLGVAEQLGVRSVDRPCLLAISIPDLEVQAEVLVRKRFDAIKRLLPVTLSRLEANGWSSFFRYARVQWPEAAEREIQDATEFCHYCARENPAVICRSELNRLNFALGKKRFAVHFARDLQIRNRKRRGLQIFVRSRRSSSQWRESMLYLGL